MEFMCPNCGKLTTNRLTNILRAGKTTKCYAYIDPATGRYKKGCGYDDMNMCEKVYIDFMINEITTGKK